MCFNQLFKLFPFILDGGQLNVRPVLADVVIGYVHVHCLQQLENAPKKEEH